MSVSKKSFTCPETTWRPAAPEPGGLSKNLKTWENLSYKNDFMPNNLSSQSKGKAYNHRLRNGVKTPPLPTLLLDVKGQTNFFIFAFNGFYFQLYAVTCDQCEGKICVHLCCPFGQQLKGMLN